MENQSYSVFTLAEKPELQSKIEELHAKGWAKFMLHDEIAAQYFGKLPLLFPQLQFVLVNQSGDAVACGNAVAFHWDGTESDLPKGWDDVLKRSVKEHQKGITANAVSAIAIVINPSFRGAKVSEFMVRKMKQLVRDNHYDYMLAPVRPSMKSKYPLTSMENYAYWKNDDGLPFDPWLRVHARTDAYILKIAPESMKIRGTIKDWENWTGMRFPQSGYYIIPDALTPIECNVEEDVGTYIEANVWMRHIL